MEQDPHAAATAPGGSGSNGEPNNAEQPANMRLVAKNYRERGWAPIPLGPKSKRPVSKDWTQQVADDKTSWPGNIGVRLGEPSAGLVDIDLDSEEARVLAPTVLPATGTVFGRPSTLAAHWLYDCGATAPAAASTGARFSTGTGEGEGQKPLLELRSTGGQTMFPPSIHPTEEQLSWEHYEQPAKVDAAELTRAVEILAAASLLLRNFPEKGARFHAYAAMIGTMLRCDVSEETISRIVAVFADRFGSPPRARDQSVKALKRRLDSGDGSVPGFPRLVEVFGKDVAQRCRGWLESDADWQRSGKGTIIAGALHNMRLAMRRLDVRFRCNEFADQMLVMIGDGKEENLEDQIVNRLWFRVEEAFGFSPPQERFRAFLTDAAYQNRFHPVRDYLDNLVWDGNKRIDSWLFDYAGIGRRDDDDYNRYVEAVGRIILVAGVRRIRQPGCKFDEMLVLISETQGTAKSTSLSILARRPEWFTDRSISA